MKSDQTCFWCHEQRPVDENGRIIYHDYPVPCRMVCRGSQRPSVEHIAATDVEFRSVVADYLEGGATLGVIVPELAEAMRREFPADSDWPRRLVAGTAIPHPLLRLKIVRWIGQQLRNVSAIMEITEEMKRVKWAAAREFEGIQGVEGVGLGGASTLIVYVRDLDTSDEIPSEFLGFYVVKIVTGSIIAAGKERSGEAG